MGTAEGLGHNIIHEAEFEQITARETLFFPQDRGHANAAGLDRIAQGMAQFLVAERLVPAGGTASDFFNAVAYTNGWYDFTVTVDSDATWSQRFTGHLETGAPSVSG